MPIRRFTQGYPYPHSLSTDIPIHPNHHRGTISTKAEAPARSNVITEAVHIPTESGILLCPNSGAGRQLMAALPTGFGLGASVRKAGGVASDTFETPSPPNAHSNAVSGFETSEEESLMTSTTKGSTPTTTSATPTEALRAILTELAPPPGERAYSGDSWLPAHLVDLVKLALAGVPVTKEAPPTIKTRGPLTFVSHTRTKRGAWVSDDYFDLDTTDRLADEKAALELVRYIKQQQVEGKRFTIVRDVLAAAGAAMHSDGPLRSAGMGFMNTMAVIVESACRHLAVERFVQARLDDKAAYWKGADERNKADIEARVRRMVAARAAKRAAKAASEVQA